MDQSVFPVCGDGAEAISGYEQRLFRLEFSNLILGDEDNSRKHLNQEVRFFVYFPDMTSVFQSKCPDFHFSENVSERWPKQTAIREKWKFSTVERNGEGYVQISQNEKSRPEYRSAPKTKKWSTILRLLRNLLSSSKRRIFQIPQDWLFRYLGKFSARFIKNCTTLK